jgi:hypothetical protein
MKTSTETLQDLLKQILALNDTIKVINWTDAEVKDTEMGIHIAKLESYLDSAVGRASSLVVRSRKLSNS